MLLKIVKNKSLYNVASMRFSSAAASEYQSVDTEKTYKMLHPVSFQGKTHTVFNSDDCKERRFVPWEIKESVFKNGMGIVGVNMMNLLFPIGPLFSVGCLSFCMNFTWTTWNLMTNAVTKIDLHDDGKRVNFTLGRYTGAVVTVNIKDITKIIPMRNLVETFEESTMFPINVGKKTYYLNGPGQEAIKNGELFRAIVNGSNVKFM